MNTDDRSGTQEDGRSYLEPSEQAQTLALPLVPARTDSGSIVPSKRNGGTSFLSFSGTSPPHPEKPKEPPFSERFVVKAIDSKTAQEVVIKRHYLHRTAPCSWAFGLYDKQNNDNLVGVIMYGVGPSSTLLKGVCGEEEAGNVCELTRLFLEDGLPTNCESYLIGSSIKMVPKQIIVSFADTSVGHVGTIYQATNFLYTGLSAKFTDPRLKSLPNLHQASFANGLSKREIIEKYVDDVEWIERPRKHRYIYFNLSSLAPRQRKKRRAELLKKLRYQILPYPKFIKDKGNDESKGGGGK